jgi:hypothetical protein
MNQEPNNQGVATPTRNGVPTATLSPAPSASIASPTMTTPPKSAPVSGGTSPDPAQVASRALLQPIEAQFYNVARNDGTPIAGLIVLVDSRKNPVRAELHLHEGISDESGRQAVRQAQHIIEDRYTGPDAIPMQVWQSFLRSDHPLPVQLNPENVAASKGAKSSVSMPAMPAMPSMATVKSSRWTPVAAVAGILALFAIVWGLWAWLGPDSSPAANSGGVGVGLESAEADLEGQELAPVESSAQTTGDLPASVNANANLSLGKRVQMITGLSQPVRSAAGANAGEEIGTLEGGAEYLIVGGPTMLPGQSDTIVWWEIQFNDDQTGWVAANTSSRPLLEPLD